METLKFYIISNEYIKYLSKFDKHVSMNKDETRPYIGIVLTVDEKSYFAPLYSPKPQHKKYKNNPTFYRMKDRHQNDIGLIRFAEMLPIPKGVATLLDINTRGKEYAELLKDQYVFINSNREIIYNKARKLYDLVVNKNINFYINLCCDFKLLEEKAKEYKVNNFY